jgi:hypothetical protein
MGTHHRTRVAASLLLALAASPAAAVRIDYAIDIGVEHTDNVALTPGDGISQNIFRPGLGFSIVEDSASLQASVTGRAEYRHYLDDAFADSLDGTLAARVNWIALPERLSFTVEDTLGLQSINTLAPDSPANRQQTNVFSLGPNLLFDINPTLRGQFELRYIDSHAEETEAFNSSRLSAALRAVKELSVNSRLSGNLQSQTVDFDDDAAARDYDRHDLFARYAQTLSRFDLGFDAGLTRIVYERGIDRGRTEPLLRADIGWRPSASSTLTLLLSKQFSDAATDALTGADPGVVTIPGSVPIGSAVINASAFEERRVALDYAYAGSRALFTLSPYVSRLDFVDSSEFDQDTRGLRTDLSWRLRPDLTLGGYAATAGIDYRRLDREDDTNQYGLYLRRQWARHWSARLELSRYERDSTEPGQDASQNVIYLSATYTR